jgi:secreted PhoX family phosphatase
LQPSAATSTGTSCIKETGDNAGAETFVWDIFLFAQAKADSGLDDANYQQNVNLSGLSEFNDLSKPDGCWFSKPAASCGSKPTTTPSRT